MAPDGSRPSWQRGPPLFGDPGEAHGESWYRTFAKARPHMPLTLALFVSSSALAPSQRQSCVLLPTI